MNQFVDDVKNLFLEVYTIGYAEKGESQIIFIRDSALNAILYSCVIDCYASNSINKTIEILEKENIKSLDCFIWTHTDEDHSIGIDKVISKHCDSKTVFFLPEGVYGHETDFVTYNDEVKETFKLINSSNENRNYSVKSASVSCEYQPLFKRKYLSTLNNSKLDLSVIAIAPISSIIRRRKESKEEIKKNDVSIATIFRCGELSLFFGGDIENQTISQIPDYLFEDLSFLKTPHHTSTSSNKLISKLQIASEEYTIPAAVSTTFKANGLPDMDLIQNYLRHVGKFHSTGTGANGFGYIKIVFDIAQNVLIEETLYGDAESFKI